MRLSGGLCYAAVWRSLLCGCVEVMVMRLCGGHGYETVWKSWLCGCVKVVVTKLVMVMRLCV